jgi:hypothetical protein
MTCLKGNEINSGEKCEICPTRGRLYHYQPDNLKHENCNLMTIVICSSFPQQTSTYWKPTIISTILKLILLLVYQRDFYLPRNVLTNDRNGKVFAQLKRIDWQRNRTSRTFCPTLRFGGAPLATPGRCHRMTVPDKMTKQIGICRDGEKRKTKVHTTWPSPPEDVVVC